MRRRRRVYSAFNAARYAAAGGTAASDAPGWAAHRRTKHRPYHGCAHSRTYRLADNGVAHHSCAHHCCAHDHVADQRVADDGIAHQRVSARVAHRADLLANPGGPLGLHVDGGR